MHENRTLFARSFCLGRGIEIGALHFPMRLPPESQVRYVDRFPVDALRRQYPELADMPLVDVDIVDDGETLGTLPDSSEDFVIAAQFIEHCQNPLRALVNMLRVVRTGGFVLITAPDKRQTFDKDRPVTDNGHILEECLRGPGMNTFRHYCEWVSLVEKAGSGIEERARELMDKGYSIHFHVWDPDAFLRFLLFAKERFQLPFEIFSTLLNGNEVMAALRKTA